jgi:dienelactone hydrolase
MPKRSMKQDDPLEDFSRREITLDGVSKHVYVAGSGPAVIVMTEMPGISPEVGAVGMCFTGNFALTMMLEPAMLAPVLSQPSLPLNDPAGIEIAPDEVKAVRDRLECEDLTVLAYRFAGDRFCMASRFATYAAALGDRFVGRVLPDSAANTDVAPFFARRVACPHSVVTAHLIDEAGQPTIAARDEILSFFAKCLGSAA